MSTTRRPVLVAAGVGLAVLALQLAFLNHDFTVDGLAYAAAVERGGPLLHSNHLLFNPLHAGLRWLLGLVGLGDLRSAWTMQAGNLVAAAIAAAAMVRIALLRGSPLVAAACGLLLVSGFGFWTFSQEPEVYLLPAACVAWSLWLLADPRPLTRARVLALALLAAAAVLLLQQYVLWYPALLWLAWRRLPGDDRARAMRRDLLLLPWLLPLLVYLLLGAANDAFGSLPATLDWFLGYGYDPETGFGTYRAAPPLAVRLMSLLFALGNLLFAYELILHPGWWAPAVAVPLLLAVALLPLRRAPRGAREAAPLLAFAAANLLFVLWWEARNIEFLLPVWLAAVAIVAGNADRLQRWPLLGAVLLLFAVNAATAMAGQRDWPARYRLAAALGDAEALAAGDVLVTEELNTVLWLDYFEARPLRFLPGAVSSAMHADRDLGSTRAQLRDALQGGARVYTLELAEHGRLRAIAERLSWLGRPLPPGGVQGAIDVVYDGFVLDPVAAVPGAYRVRLRERGG